MFNYLKNKTMNGMSEREFMEKFRSFMNEYKRNSMRGDNFYDDHYTRRHGSSDDFMNMFGRNRGFSRGFDDLGEEDMYHAMKMFRNSMNNENHFSESEAKYLVADMCHTENGRKYTGEKFDMRKAKEISERYKGVLPPSVSFTDVYVAINSQYHDYAELFKSWFGNDIEQKIIESAIVFWFKDVDAKSENKLMEYFKEY